MGLERGQLAGEPAMGIGKRLARFIQHRCQCLDLSDQFCSFPEGLDDEHLPRGVRVHHAAGTAASPD